MTYASERAASELQKLRHEIEADHARTIAELRAEIARLTRERDEAREWQRQHRSKRDVARAAAKANHEGIDYWRRMHDEVRAAFISAEARAETAEAEVRRAHDNFIIAWEALPGGRHSQRDVQNWLVNVMKPAVDRARAARQTGGDDAK